MQTNEDKLLSYINMYRTKMPFNLSNQCFILSNLVYSLHKPFNQNANTVT